MLRHALLSLPLSLSLSLVACNRGPTNREVFEQNKALVVTIDQGVAAVVKSIEAAPPPALGAACEVAGLTMDQPVVLDAEKDKLGVGNTELVEWKGLSGAFSVDRPGPPGSDEEWKGQDPAGYQLRFTTSKANMFAARHYLAKGGFLYEGGRAPDDRTTPTVVSQVARTKGITHLIVVRGRPSSDTGRSQVVEVHSVEFPGGKWVCGFAYEGKVAANVANSDTIRIQRSGNMETRTGGVDDAIGRALRTSVIDGLSSELKKRFNLVTDINPSR